MYLYKPRQLFVQISESIMHQALSINSQTE